MTREIVGLADALPDHVRTARGAGDRDHQGVAFWIAQPEHRRHGVAHTADLRVDVDTIGLQLGVAGINVIGLQPDARSRLPVDPPGGGGTTAIVVTASAGATSTQ